MQNELQKILNVDEKVLWQGTPDKVIYYAQTFFATLVGGAVVVGLVNVLKSSMIDPSLGNLIVIVAAVIILLIPLYNIFLYPHIQYLITDKRIIIQGGLIGRDFDFVDYDKVENAQVNVSIIDKLFGRNTGSLLIYANRLQTIHYKNSVGTQNVPFVLSRVTDPYTVFNFLKKTSFDVKADINYPNALRPDANPGYKTDYTVPKQ